MKSRMITLGAHAGWLFRFVFFFIVEIAIHSNDFTGACQLYGFVRQTLNHVYYTKERTRRCQPRQNTRTNRFPKTLNRRPAPSQSSCTISRGQHPQRAPDRSNNRRTIHPHRPLSPPDDRRHITTTPPPPAPPAPAMAAPQSMTIAMSLAN